MHKFKQSKVLILLTICLLLALSTAVNAEEDLLSLSLKELLYVPLQKTYDGKNIFQSDKNKVSENSHNFGIIAPIASTPRYSTEIIAAADLAADDINSFGGINGQKLVIVRGDDKDDPNFAINLVEKMHHDFGITTLIGAGNSTIAQNLLQGFNNPAYVPLLSHAATSNRLNEIGGGTTFWRIAASNRQQVDKIIEELAQKNRHKNVFVIGDRDLYSNEIIQGVKQRLSDLGYGLAGEIRLSSWVNMNEMDIRAETYEVRRAKPSAIVLTLRSSVINKFLRRFGELWKEEYPPIVTGDTTSIDGIELERVGNIKYCVRYLTSVSTQKEHSDLKNRIEQLLDVKSSGFDVGYIYDAVML
ncbi:MAG: ABC transporter substrate-binding protein [Kangiellaceae bacterium]|nr:ABC transporter substrate-binding protein [Kangiellaceae bacterium]MCW8999799.1 ABC transporter substrate-binding protein [Kangiellaceae bacterium]